MKNERESPGRNIVPTEDNIELSRAAQTPSGVANGRNNAEDPTSRQTDSGGGRQAELRSLRDALWEAITAIEEKAPGAAIERELVILDHLADGLGDIMYEAEAESMRCGLQKQRTK
jgi:hypothetical protein